MEGFGRSKVLEIGGTVLALSMAPGVASAATVTVSAGQSIQAAIDGASPGDRVEVEAGDWLGVELVVDKPLELVASPVHGARLLGQATPPSAANAGTLPDTAILVVSDDVLVEGFEVAYYTEGIFVSDSQNVEVAHNRITSCSSAGFTAWDAKDVEVHHNAFIDPYLENDAPNTLWDTTGVDDAQMDYGANFYGVVDPVVQHNYFFGVFNQALSFKDGNRNAYAAYNTFEGFIYTALWFGQNPDRDGTFDVFGQDGTDTGHMQAIGNVFRPSRAVHQGDPVPYRARTPIRLWHAEGEIDIIGNVIDSGHVGVYFECDGDECVRGTVNVADNVFNGRTDTVDGPQHVGDCGLAFDAGLMATVAVEHNTIANFNTGVCPAGASVALRNNQFYANGEAVNGDVDESVGNNAFESGSPPPGSSQVDPLFAGSLDPEYLLLDQVERFEPRSCLARALWLQCDSPSLDGGIDGTHVGAYGAPCDGEAPSQDDACLLTADPDPPGGGDETGGSDDDSGGATGDDTGGPDSDGAGSGPASEDDGDAGTESGGGEAGGASAADATAGSGNAGACTCSSSTAPPGALLLLLMPLLRRSRAAVRKPSSAGCASRGA